jgi:hypothetical protein
MLVLTPDGPTRVHTLGDLLDRLDGLPAPDVLDLTEQSEPTIVPYLALPAKSVPPIRSSSGPDRPRTRGETGTHASVARV